ncbi:TonB-dependent receptor [Variovorax sp. J22P168]|uniref:TonB-dependent receptor n=1 Tax=Variovorax jilinensis TaxID=3053513 RepID=UPI00257864FD|nr:TonB-dependent receptor [Variovorax sp. J22P168]MDM0013997.1 TonB-dependent receptor [Variovorax sp. J22P168]
MTPHRLPLRPVALACALALQAFVVAAQTAPAADAAAQGGTLATVTVEASADASAEGLAKPFAGGQVANGARVGLLGTTSLMDTPFSITSYTNQLIQDQQAQSVADVLLNAPSIRQARGFGNFQELYVVRGFPMFSDDIAYNGLYGMLPRQYIASEFFERVEVLLGPNAFLNGAAPGGSSIGGAINLVPKRAPNEPLTRVGLGVQSGGEGSGSFDIARRFGPDESTGVRLNGVYRNGGTGVDDEKRELGAVGVGIDWRSRNVRLSADVGYQDHTITEGRPSVTPGFGLPIPTPPDAKSNFAQPWTYSKERDTFGTVRGEVDFNDNVTGWVAGGMREGKESNSVANLTMTNVFGGASAYRFDNEREDKVSTGEIGVRGKFRTGSVGHNLVASANAYDDQERNAYGMSGSTILTNIYAPVASLPPPANLYTGGILSRPQVTEKTKTSSFAIADTMSFAQDTVLLTIGARRQTIEQTSYNFDSGLETSSYDESKTTPVAGVVFRATKDISVYGNYIEGLLKGDVAPSFTASGQPIANAGQVFAPAVSKQKEIGVKYENAGIGATAAVFEITKPQSFVVNGVYGDNGEQRNRGFELAVFGEPVRGLRVLGGLTLLDAEQKRTEGGLTDGNDVIGVPRQQFNLGAEWDIPGVRGLAVNARFIYTSKQYADAANLQQLPDWNRFDLGARYLMDIGNGRLLTLRARVDNVFNKAYWASTGGYPGSNYLVMGAPRTFVLNASVDF